MPPPAAAKSHAGHEIPAPGRTRLSPPEGSRVHQCQQPARYSMSVTMSVLVRASKITSPRGERNFLTSGASSAARA